MKHSSIFVVALVAYMFSSSGFSANNAGANSKQKNIEIPGTEWRDGDRKREYWLAKDQVVIFSNHNISEKELVTQSLTLVPSGKVLEKNALFTRVRLPNGSTDKQLSELFNIEKLPQGVSKVTAVYKTDPKNEEVVHILTGEMIVILKDNTTLSYLESRVSSSQVRVIEKLPYNNAYLLTCPPGPECIALANKLYVDGNIEYAYPNWLRGRQLRSSAPRGGAAKKAEKVSEGRFSSLDPLIGDQWHLGNTGQGGGTVGEDANVITQWVGDPDPGANTVIAVVDDGMEIGHEDLAGNVVFGMSYDWVDGDTDPTAGDHGTACAGVAAAVGYNGIGVSGVAPYAGIVGHRLLGATTDTNEADALTRNKGLIDVYSNSWGPSDTGANLAGPGPLALAALASGVSYADYTWAGGNGRGSGDNSNYDGYAGSRYTIAVAATTNTGEQSYYSEPGANILINAPSNGGTLGITTVDRTGAVGYDTGNYTSTFGGTSSATPLVSGIISLMRSWNSSLGWRDVQQILATSASKNDPTHTDWIQNGAGNWINHAYGFGRVDAEAAVEAAKYWNLVGPEVSATVTVSPGLSIPQPENSPGGFATVNLTMTGSVQIEYAELSFDSDITYWGDLTIKLTSPAGTESVLAEGHSGSGAQYDGGWKFGVARLLGENSQGTWTLTVLDNFSGDTGSINNVQLTVYGTAGGNSTFDDVSPSYWAFDAIEEIASLGITNGCSQTPSLYCPASPVTRAQMAIFLLRSKHGRYYNPPAATGTVFNDVGIGYWAAGWIEQLANEGITTGCGGGNYCPTHSVTRAQMSLFMLRTLNGSGYVPPSAIGIFSDVTPGYWAADFIEQLYMDNITGGCSQSPLSYCPTNAITRAQMAVFLTRAFFSGAEGQEQFDQIEPEGEFDVDEPKFTGPSDL